MVCSYTLGAYLTLLFLITAAQDCKNGYEIIDIGVDEYDEEKVVALHNKYRTMISNGQVVGQPQGINLLEMKYDKLLGDKARELTLYCAPHDYVVMRDVRWKNVGTNYHMEMSNFPLRKQNWDIAIAVWFSEHKKYTYGKEITNATRQYTQIVWANTNLVGCDFIMYKDPNCPVYPYRKLYYCNYGPGGNIVGQNPYEGARPY